MSANKSTGAASHDARSSQDSSFDEVQVDSELIEDLGAEFEFRGDVASAELGEKAEQLDEAVARADEYQDRFVRLQAEWGNFRKRLASEQEVQRIRSNEKLVESLLPALDDMERALEHAGDGPEATAFTDGIRAVHTKLISALENASVVVIDPKDEPFDATLHNAVQKVDDPSVYDETVASVIQKGYMLGGYVIRPAMVLVSSGGPLRPSDPEQTTKE